MQYQKIHTVTSKSLAFSNRYNKFESFNLWALNPSKWLFLLALFTVSLFNGSMVSTAKASEIESSIQMKASSEIEIKREYLKHIINQQERLVTSLVETPFMSSYLSKNEKLDQDSLSELFLTTATINKHYMQVRFIDANGQEKIRIEQSKNGLAPIVVKEEALQDKSEREYFTETKKLPAGERWYSSFDLNKEQGEIEQWINPTYRVSSPVYVEGKFSGIVIINLDMTNVIGYLTESADFLVYLVDADNEVLVHPDPKKSWSKYLTNKNKYQETPEKASKNYTQSLEDIFNNGEGIRIILEPIKATYSLPKTQ
ncbi:cache domain-containing protein [Psychromonas sp. SP041]|uniref:cache domain-containing protein n=1 Tax=Psychromonas sp. SP041 TaxID=1365007 RepID=UPI0010C7BD4C|nr:cache domain-containing protein [Psychromonas sp. SP041]